MEEKIYSLEEIKKIVQPIFKHYGIDKAYIFGSYARGEATSTSDVDILISRGNLKSLLQLSGLGVDLEENLMKDVDIVTLETYTKQKAFNKYEQRAKDIFFNEIKKDMVLIYE